jgi:Ca2+-transporting ATPase
MYPFNSIQPPGLTKEQAQQRLVHDGVNELNPPQRRTLLHIVREIASEPMFLLLLAAGALYMLLGDLQDAAMLLTFVILTVFITVMQEARTERSLQALRELSSPRALVVRDGAQQRIAGKEVVRGDILVLTDGDRVAADAELISAHDLQVDESLLTGESMPVIKTLGLHLKDETNRQVYAGSLVVSGQGIAQVIATGSKTRMGSIGIALQSIDMPPTPLKVQTQKLVRLFTMLGVAVSVLVVLLFGWLRHDWSGGLLAGITLAMSMLPEEFILILTVFMAMGAWRLSVQRVLARRSATIEALGSATVLCTDKTGTLTRNRMEIVKMAIHQQNAIVRWKQEPTKLPDGFKTLVEFGILASELTPFDPMDKAFKVLGKNTLSPQYLHADWQFVHEYGLSPELIAMTHVWQPPAVKHSVVAIKGGAEAVLQICNLAAKEMQLLMQEAVDMAATGLRVLAVARAEYTGAQWPASPHSFDFKFLGLVGLADPLRAGVQQAIQECKNAGIRVVMVTGDHPVTASAIASQAGLLNHGNVATGAELAALDDVELLEKIQNCAVFARVQPDQKLRIVQALQARGEVVAMTGDGVNDAPSLKAAHIGIAMGGRGTDVAREASSLVLLDDDFISIIHAIRLGRRIYDNLRKAFAFAFAVHVPIAGLSLMPLLLDLPLMLAPVHIAFLELIISPVCSIVFESETEESDLMQRQPRPVGVPLFSRPLIISSLLQGALVLLVVGAFFIHLLESGVPTDQARGASFIALVGCSVMLILVNRAMQTHVLQALRRPNPMFWGIVGITTVLLVCIFTVTPLREAFHFEPLTPWFVGIGLGLSVVVLLVLEGAKWTMKYLNFWQLQHQSP